MKKCQIFYINRTQSSLDEALPKEELRSVTVLENYSTSEPKAINAEPKKLNSAVKSKLEETDRFIFMNAVDSADQGSFRKLFYELVSSLEKSVQPSKAGISAKLKIRSLGDLGNGYRGYCFTLKGKEFIVLPTSAGAGKSNSELLTLGCEKAAKIFDIQAESYPDGLIYLDQKGNETDPPSEEEAKNRKKQGFFLSFIPLKEDSKNQKIRKIVVLVAIVAFIVALAYVLEFFIFGPMRNNAVNSEIQEIAHSTSGSDSSDESSAQDWDALKEINDEIVGWINIPDTVVDYPVLQHDGDDRYSQYYLNRNYKKESSEYGSVFLDYRSNDGTYSKNVIMHGHNMRDGSMFHEIMNYTKDLKGDLEYYQEHPVITFNTPDGDSKWKIISVFKTSTRYEHGEFFNYMQGDFNSEAEFMNFVYNVRIRSMFDIPVTVNEDDQIITLSTCCYEFYQWRCVVVARKVRPGEDENVDTDLASLNSSPLFPDVYYSRYGGERPDMGTFKSANKKGEVSWYDGKGNLEGSEDLTATVAANPTEPPTEAPKPGATKATEPPEVTYYEVIYRNYDGSQYAAYNVKEGDTVPTPDGEPTMPEDEGYTYRFDGWDKNVDGVNFDSLNVGIDIYPIFTPVPKE